MRRGGAGSEHAATLANHPTPLAAPASGVRPDVSSRRTQMASAAANGVRNLLAVVGAAAAGNAAVSAGILHSRLFGGGGGASTAAAGASELAAQLAHALEALPRLVTEQARARWPTLAPVRTHATRAREPERKFRLSLDALATCASNCNAPTSPSAPRSTPPRFLVAAQPRPATHLPGFTPARSPAVRARGCRLRGPSPCPPPPPQVSRHAAAPAVTIVTHTPEQARDSASYAAAALSLTLGGSALMVLRLRGGGDGASAFDRIACAPPPLNPSLRPRSLPHCLSPTPRRPRRPQTCRAPRSTRAWRS